MAVWKDMAQRDVPVWAFLAIACIGVVILGYVGWRTFAGGSAEVGPPKRVYPGMYDLRAEAAKARAAREQGTQQNGP